MKKTKITGKELRKIGYPEGPVISVAMTVVASEYKHVAKDEVETLLAGVLANPSAYLDHKILYKIAINWWSNLKIRGKPSSY